MGPLVLVDLCTNYTLEDDGAIEATSSSDSAVSAGRAVSADQYLEMLCVDGYHGALCGACESGYGRSRMLMCDRCKERNLNTFYYLLIVGVRQMRRPGVASSVRCALYRLLHLPAPTPRIVQLMLILTPPLGR